ncbi:hypothetical protein RF11_06160 [Thelohanellus kitauei]|uniref:Uncharacterized protein n=1 Tax=Thelohanellus kitauei TaxID=669202 RepID=A0A0C2MXE7_THEKT|nr:hypothetical protein RF11_06160 [Thelohanellus kitauei]
MFYRFVCISYRTVKHGGFLASNQAIKTQNSVLIYSQISFFLSSLATLLILRLKQGYSEIKMVVLNLEKLAEDKKQRIIWRIKGNNGISIRIMVSKVQEDESFGWEAYT